MRTTLTSAEFKDISVTIQNTLLPDVDVVYLDTLVKSLLEEFNSVGEETLRSIIAFEYEKTMKKTHQDCIANANELYDRYLETDCTKPPYKMALLPMAKELNLAPALLARIIVNKHFEKFPLDDNNDERTTLDITEMMKTPETIPDDRLSLEVEDCLVNDDFYGPEPDAIKQCMGDEFELYLRRAGAELGIKFVDEGDSRGEGFDKTPDLKLEAPVLVDGTRIHWIESKALFGSEELHQSYILEQYDRYCKRFGAGLVIYWFGFVDNIHFTTGDLNIIISENFPIDAISHITKHDDNHQRRSVHPGTKMKTYVDWDDAFKRQVL